METRRHRAESDAVLANPPVPRPDRHKLSVAAQADEQIISMQRSDLIRFVRMADLPTVCGGAMDRLEYLGRADLEQLAFLTRRCCRNQINSYSRFLGRSAPFLADV